MILYRMCIFDRKKYEKKSMLKVTRISNKWKLDEVQNLNGRSFYLNLDNYNRKNFKKKINFFIRDNDQKEYILLEVDKFYEQNYSNN